MSGLPRQVIKWLQSLDLSIPVKNPKRDFCNGYLIAEIFSRYYPNEIQIWSFYTGSSTSQKANNWGVLAKFFKKHKIQIPREAMEAVMNCQQGAAHLFIENIYMLLTDSMIPRSASLTNPLLSFAPEELVPHFALPTTSHVIKRIAESPLKARMVVESHKDFIRELRGALQKSGQETQIVGIVSKGDVKSVLKAGKSDKKIVKDGNPLPILPMDPRPKKDQGLWAKEIRVNQTV